jgi:hypothetical protein
VSEPVTFKQRQPFLIVFGLVRAMYLHEVVELAQVASTVIASSRASVCPVKEFFSAAYRRGVTLKHHGVRGRFVRGDCVRADIAV